MIWLSLKTYEESSGESLIKLLNISQDVSGKTKVPIIPCLQVVDIYRAKEKFKMDVWAQHVDPIDPGRNSGWISPKSVRYAGASGVVINHAERPLKVDQIKKTLQFSKKYGLKTLVICETPALCRKVSKWKPNFIAYEKGYLIAGPKSMIDEEEESIKGLAKKLHQPLIVGAGIISKAHVVKTLKAGAKGIILASAVILAKDPKEKLFELASGFKL